MLAFFACNSEITFSAGVYLTPVLLNPSALRFSLGILSWLLQSSFVCVPSCFRDAEFDKKGELILVQETRRPFLYCPYCECH